MAAAHTRPHSVSVTNEHARMMGAGKVVKHDLKRPWWQGLGRWFDTPQGDYVQGTFGVLGMSLVFTIVAWVSADELLGLVSWVDDVPNAVRLVFSLIAGGTVFTVGQLFYHWRQFGRDINYLRQIRQDLVALRDTALGKFAEKEILSELRGLTEEYSRLAGGGTSLTLRRKMRIASALHDPEYFSATKRYWATTIDDPVEMIKDRGFFNRHARLRATSRQRLAVMSVEAYRDTILDSVALERFTKFVKWHRENRFELRVLLREVSVFFREAQQAVYLGCENVLTDFAVLDDRHVFGASLCSRPEGSDRQVVRLVSGHEVVQQYADFFRCVWEDPEALSIDVVENDCADEAVRNTLAEVVQDEYDPYFGQARKGAQFFDKLISLVGDSNRIVAVDVASLKDPSNLAAWMQSSYLAMVGATVSAARKGAECKRVYVLDGAVELCVLERLAAIVFAPQVEAGVQIFLIPASSLRKVPSQPRDFIVFDLETFTAGFGLARWEPFEPESLGLRNLFLMAEVFELVRQCEEWQRVANATKPVADVSECLTRLREVLESPWQ